MNHPPRVSAIIIFYNGGRYLAEAIESVIAQSYPHWELLLVDDGSTDSSTGTAQDYAAKYPTQIRYLQHPGHKNLGMSAARNLGIAHATGEYIAFLDADDIWLANKLTEQVDLFARHPETVMLYGRTLLWHSWTGLAADQAKDYIVALGVEANQLIMPPQMLAQSLQFKYQSPTTCNAMIRRDFFDQYGYFEDSFRATFEDRVLFTKVFLHVPVYVDDRLWAFYRQHPQSNSAFFKALDKNVHQVIAAKARFFRWLVRYFWANKVIDPRAWAAVLKGLFYSQQSVMVIFLQLRRIKRFCQRRLQLQPKPRLAPQSQTASYRDALRKFAAPFEGPQKSSDPPTNSRIER